jgi:hypothetical protein
MATEIGTGTSYPITIPAGIDPADIQTALRYISYGIGSTPSTNSDITSNSIFGKMSLLAPKAGPAFTGNGSITGNFSIGGNLTITGSIDVLSSTTALIKDKKVILGSGDVTNDAGADGGGIQLSGTTSKTFLWIDGTDSWTSSEHINLGSTSLSYKIAGTTVLTSSAVLGITGTNIATLSGTQTITGAKTFAGSLQTINGVTFDTNGGISRTLVSNEWTPIVTYKPTSPVTYLIDPLTSEKIGQLANGNTGYRYFDEGSGQPIFEPFYNFTYRLRLQNPSQTVPLIPNQTVYLFVDDYGLIPWTVLGTETGAIIARTNNSASVPGFFDGVTLGLGGAVVDYYEETSIQEWKYGGVSGTVAAQVTSEGAIESLNGFREIGKTYHTNAGVPYFDVGLASSSATVFSVTTGLTTPWQNIATAANATASTTSRWYPAGFSATSANGNMSYALSGGIGYVTVSQSGLYNLSASLTVGESEAANMVGLFINNGTMNEPFITANMSTSGITSNISTTKYLNAGEKVGLAVYNGNDSSAATNLSVTAANYKSVRLSGYLVG